MDPSVANVVEHILTSILQWRVLWLEEQKACDQPPPICRAQPKKLKITYDNYKDYESTFVPLLMHEIWAQIYEEWTKLQAEINNEPMDLEVDDFPSNSLTGPNERPFRGRSDATNCPRQFWIGVLDYRSEGQFQCMIKCQYLCPTNKVNHHLKIIGEGDLVCLDLILAKTGNVRNDDSNDRLLSLFGYVVDVTSERVNKYSTFAECFVKLDSKNYHTINYSVVIAKRPLRLDLSQPMRISCIYYLKPMIRQIESVATLKESALASDILCPKLITCQLSIPTVADIKSPHYNDMQYKAIIGANEALVRNIPKIQLIQGPPGTGKTHTLIGIMKHFFLNWTDTAKPLKVLICAPSNGAIDEVARRLYKERDFLKKSPFRRSLRMVRVGNPDQINDAVKIISLDELVESNALNKVDSLKKKHMNKIQELERELSRCDTEITNLRYLKRHSEIPTIELKIAHLMKDLEANKAAEGATARREISESSKRSLRFELVKNTDVILTTLNSCQRHPIDIMFKGDRSDLSFHCVIVDEASQCCEPELLMPLCYNISKMILIGDPMQLPATVISRYAQEFDFGRSLFERFFAHFGEYSSESPIAMLTDQYRMHPDICRFPSLQFYDNRLVTATKPIQFYPLKPYTIFDLKYGTENRVGKKTIENDAEANLVRNLLVALCSSAPEGSQIGVITPYKGQKRLITHKIRAIQTERNITIDVNTCDGFQGQEKDIIILSCVRAFDSGGSIGFLKSTQRINVALTRAKNCLILCLSSKAVFKDKTWYALLNDANSRQTVKPLSYTPSSGALTEMISSGRSNASRANPSKLVRVTNSNPSYGNVYEPEFVMPMDVD